MKAIILAGGRGERLYPLTENCPKPLVRLCGRPIIDYVLGTLAKSGVTEGILTLGYGAEQILECLGAQDGGSVVEWERPGAEEALHITLRFCVEDAPRGTAGGVHEAFTRFVTNGREPVVIISADTLCDLPLEKALALHNETQADATLVTVSATDPHEYGIVRTDAQGRITSFLEKPSFTQSAGGLVNTGIYILPPMSLNMIPFREKTDFACDVFPKMLMAGLHLQSCTLDGYWRDIGSIESYRVAQRDLLRAHMTPASPFIRDQHNNILKAQGMHRPLGHYQLTAPVYIGAGVQIAAGACVEGCSVLDDGVHLASGAHVSGGVLLPHSTVLESARVHQGILCTGALAGRRAVLEPDSVLGEDAAAGTGVRLCAGALIASHSRLSPGETVREGARETGSLLRHFDDEGLCGEVGDLLTPEFAARVGCALGTAAPMRSGMPPQAVGVACDGSPAARALCDALTCGIRSTGTAALVFGGIFEAMFAFAMSYNALPLGVYVRAKEKGGFRLLCEGGLPVTRALEREVEQALTKNSFSRAGAADFGELLELPGVNVMYQLELMRLAPDGLSGMYVVVPGTGDASRLLRNVLEKLGCTVHTPVTRSAQAEDAALQLEKAQADKTRIPVTMQISADGRRLTMIQNSCMVNDRRSVALGCMILLNSQDVALENDFPRCIDAFAQQQGRRVLRYLVSSADSTDAPGRVLARRQHCLRDALMLAVMLLSYMKSNCLCLEELNALVPPFETAESIVPVGDSIPAKALHSLLLDQGETLSEGVLSRDDRGIVLLRPKKNGSAIRIFAEAASFEAAQELCDDFEERLRSLLDNQITKGYNGVE